MRFKKTIISGIILLLAGSAMVVAIHGNKNVKRTVTWDHGFKITQFQRKTIPLTTLKSVDMDLDDFYVNVVRGDKLSLKITTPADNFPLVSGTDSGALELKAHNTHNSDFNLSLENVKSSVTLTIPADTKLEHLAVKNSDGESVIKEINANVADLQNGDGAMTLEHNSFGQTTIRQDDGRLRIAETTMHTLHLNMGDGLTTITNSTLQAASSLDTEDGRVLVTDSAVNRLRLKNEDGAVDLNNLKLTGYLNISNDDGRLSLNKVAADGYTITSGDGAINFDGKRYQNLYNTKSKGSAMVVIDNRDGSINIKTK